METHDFGTNVNIIFGTKKIKFGLWKPYPKFEIVERQKHFHKKDFEKNWNAKNFEIIWKYNYRGEAEAPLG